MSDDRLNSVVTALTEVFSDIAFAPAPLMKPAPARPVQRCIRIPADRLLDVMRFLLEDDRCLFEQLADLTCVDYLNFPDATDRYGVVYNLLSVTHGHRLFAKCFANDPKPKVPSVVSIWKGADWLEREVYDLFGVTFDGHPDLRRLLTWDGFDAHPLRKDYPLRGRGERENFDPITRESA